MDNNKRLGVMVDFARQQMEKAAQAFTHYNENQAPDTAIRMATLEIDEAQFELINTAMKALKVRCKKNAISCLTGYGSAGSAQKAEDWNNKAKAIDDLMSRIRTEMS